MLSKNNRLILIYPFENQGEIVCYPLKTEVNLLLLKVSDQNDRKQVIKTQQYT
jgi:hypothetical protein